uniref:Uncharacterized protein n=1 Tax=Globodera rostochiensis TaxID=31243 RepID=A0A914HJ30_GLORO
MPTFSPHFLRPSAPPPPKNISLPQRPSVRRRGRLRRSNFLPDTNHLTKFIAASAISSSSSTAQPPLPMSPARTAPPAAERHKFFANFFFVSHFGDLS